MDQPLGGIGDPGRSVVLSTIAKASPVIVGVAAVFGAAGILLSNAQPEQYTAETRVTLSATGPFDPLASSTANASSRYVANQVELIGSRAVLERAATDLQADPLTAGTDVTDLRQSLDVSPLEGADVLVLTTTGPTGAVAAARGNSIAYAYSASVRQLVAEAVQQATPPVPPAPVQPVDPAAEPLVDPLRAAQIAERARVYDDGVLQIQSPDVPTEPSAPQPLRNGFLLAALGALIAVAVAVWRRGEPLADRAALVESAGAPVLGVVPVPLRRLLARRSPPLPVAADYSMALVAIGYVAGETTGVVMISGVSRDSGAQSVALGLAAAAAEQQRRVVVVDADTQRFALVHQSGHNAPALSIGALSDPDSSDAGAVREITELRAADGTGSVHLATVVGGEHRWGADAVRRGLQRLVDSYDVVVVHAGPVASDPMAFALLRETAVLVAVVDERARTSDLLALREKLELAGASADGLVLTHRVPGRRRTRPAAVADLPVAVGDQGGRPAAPSGPGAPAGPVGGQPGSAAPAPVPAGGSTAAVRGAAAADGSGPAEAKPVGSGVTAQRR